MKTKLLLFSLTLFALIVSACGSATPVPPTATVAPVVPVTAPSTDTPVAALPSGPAVVNVGQNVALGSFLVDSKGMTLYLFTKDTPNTSVCYGGCATAWPPLLTTGAPTSGTGVTASMLGTTARTDGTTQVTYNGFPLYYWAKDKVAGDTTGQGVQNVWYVISPAGVSSAPASASGAAVVNVGQNAALGTFLVDSKGMTLYLFTKDTPNTSNCYGGCATAWPPLLTTGAPLPGTGVDDSKLGTTTRTDGTIQVTYNGWPLYYWAKDKVAGDTTGEGVQNVWYVITSDGKQK